MEKKEKTGTRLNIAWEDTAWPVPITEKSLAEKTPRRNSTLIVITAQDPDEHAPRAA